MGSVPTTGPACLSLGSLVDCLVQLPAADNGASTSSTKAVLNLLNSAKHLQIFSLRVAVDELLHVGALIQGYYQRPTSSNTPVTGAVLVVDDIDDGFAKVTALTAHITGEKASSDPYTNSAISSFSRIVVVRGHKAPRLCSNANIYKSHLNASARNVISTITRLSQKFCLQRVIWHNHSDPTLLLHVLELTKNPPIDAITVFEALKLDTHAITLTHPAPNHTSAVPKPWSRLITATKALHNNHGIPLVFFSSASLRTSLHNYSTHHLIGLRDFFPVLLPSAVWKPVLGSVLDQLLVGVMRLLAGGDLSPRSPYRTPAQIVTELKRRLPAPLARGWARLCLDERSYGAAAIRHTVRGALPSANPAAPLPTLAGMTQTIAAPLPNTPATALNRLALGPHAAASPIHAVRTSIVPRPHPPGTVAVTIDPRASTFLLTPTDPARLQTALAARWTDHIAATAQRERAFPTQEGSGFGVERATAEVWVGVVKGVVAGVVREWGVWVAKGLNGEDKRRVERAVEVLVQEAREGAFTRVCEGVVRGG